MNRLNGKIAIVIGATSGMGRAIAKLFAEEGAQVVCTGRRADKGQSLEREIIEAGGKGIFVQADSTKSDELKKIFDVTMEQFGRIDVLVNNAGTSATTLIEDTSHLGRDKRRQIPGIWALLQRGEQIPPREKIQILTSKETLLRMPEN